MTLAILAFSCSFLLLKAQTEAPAQEDDTPARVEASAAKEASAPNEASEAADLPALETAPDQQQAPAGDKPAGPKESSTPSSAETAFPDAVGAPVDVYVIPITEAIGKPNLFILRRGLKEAIEKDIDMVLLEMDTPGGRVDITIEMMEMLARFDGITATYVNDEAISAGSFITAATQEIYFAPTGKIGASAVIMGAGQEVPETAKLKIESYLRANIRAITADYPYRSDVIRAMLDAEYELVIDDVVIKPAGELLTLTASEAVQAFGEPPQPLLGLGIYDSIEALLDARFGPGNYLVKDFEVTYSERIAKWMDTFAPALLGLGMLLLFLEFKTPGFGFFGISGIALIAVFFISQHIAGLAGNEVFLFFALGLVLVAIEIFLFPGSVVFALGGLGLMLGSLLWAMVDIWPAEPLDLSPGVLAEPLFNLALGLIIAVIGIWIAARFFAGSRVERRLVLAAAAGGDSRSIRSARNDSLPQAGATGVAVTDLFPSGRVEIDGRRFEARSALGPIQRGTAVCVLHADGFGLVVRANPGSQEVSP